MAMRALVMLLAFLLAALAASVSFEVYAFGLMLKQAGWSSVASAVPFFLQGVVMVYLPLAAAALVPTLVVVIISEIYRLRSITFYFVTSAVVAVVSSLGFKLVLSLVMFRPKNSSPLYSLTINWAFVVCGGIAGLVYWAVAGRHAGMWREDRK